MSDETLEVVVESTLRLSQVKEALAAVGRQNDLAGVEDVAGAALTIRARVNRRCWALGATHEHETFVVDQNGNRFIVDNLVLHQDIGGEKKNVDGGKTSQVGRTETEVNFGCRSSCARGTATHWGVTWSTNWICV
jgi:hypothetical protein